MGAAITSFEAVKVGWSIPVEVTVPVPASTAGIVIAAWSAIFMPVPPRLASLLLAVPAFIVYATVAIWPAVGISALCIVSVTTLVAVARVWMVLDEPATVTAKSALSIAPSVVGNAIFAFKFTTRVLAVLPTATDAKASLAVNALCVAIAPPALARFWVAVPLFVYTTVTTLSVATALIVNVTSPGSVACPLVLEATLTAVAARFELSTFTVKSPDVGVPVEIAAFITTTRLVVLARYADCITSAQEGQQKDA
jgi:hypothetical protein